MFQNIENRGGRCRHPNERLDDEGPLRAVRARKGSMGSVVDQAVTTSISGSTSCLIIPSMAIKVPVSELGQLPHAP